MTDKTPAPALDQKAISTLPTKLEEDFIAPLTAIRGALEILRDFPDLSADEAQAFVTSALQECARIEYGLRDLSASVYATSEPGDKTTSAGRTAMDKTTGIAELDFTDLTFDTPQTVTYVFDEILAQIEPTGRRWWFLVNFTGTHIFPEAWIAFAHRGKEIRVKYGYGTIRFAADGAGGLPDRDGALDQIAQAKRDMR